MVLISGQTDARLQSDAHGLRTAPLAKSMATYLRNHYIPSAITWSTYQASYTLGKEGGGISWKEENLRSSDFSSESKTVWSDEAQQILNKAYLKGEFPDSRTQCKMRFPQHSVGVLNRRAGIDSSSVRAAIASAAGEGIIGASDSGDSAIPAVRYTVQGGSIEVVCASRTTNTSVYIDVRPEWVSPGNRYFVLQHEIATSLRSFNDDVDGLAGSTYSGSGSSCDSQSDATSEARSEAKADARDAIQNKFSPFSGGLPGGVTATTTSIDPSASVVSVETDTIEDGCSREKCPDSGGSGGGTGSDGGSGGSDGGGDSGSSDGGDDQDCTTIYWDKNTATATAEPTGGSVTVTLKDARRTLPTADGRRNLVYRVEDASFSIDSQTTAQPREPERALIDPGACEDCLNLLTGGARG